MNTPKCTNKYHSEIREARLDSQNQPVDASATMGDGCESDARKVKKKWLPLSSNSAVQFLFGI
jgi:hypothetical protein